MTTATPRPTLAPTTGDPLRPPPSPTPEQVVLLQAVRSYPAVSVLMRTTPAPVMTASDARRLGVLVAQASARLASEELGRPGQRTTTALEELQESASRGPTGKGLALFASSATALAVPLPVDVRDRVVVDPTFATRDLVRALHRTPRHVVLVLNSGEARLFSGAGGALSPGLGTAFPLRNERERRAGRSRSGDTGADAFLRQVDDALGTWLRLHPAPLVLVGPDRVLAAFTRISKNLARLAGTLSSNVMDEPLTGLAARCRPVLERYLLSREQEALALVELRAGAHRVVSGMESCWLAARREGPEMLAVEEGLFFPARLDDSGDLLIAASDVEHPDVLDDAVDELIELVLERGGWVALVQDGALSAHSGVALTVRRRD